MVRLHTENPRGIRAVFSFQSLLPYSAVAEGNEISIEGYAAYHSLPVYHGGSRAKHLYDPERGIHFRTLVRVLASDGRVESFPSGDMKLDGVTEALVLIANVTSFNGFDKDPVREGRDYRRIVSQRMERAAAKSFEDLRKAHVANYTSYFSRVKLDLGKTDKSVSVKDEKLFSLIKNFVETVGFCGIIDIDIFRRGDEYCISEVNPRFGGGYPHAYECGVNVPAQIIRNLEGKANEEKIGAYEEGICMMKYNEIMIRRQPEEG